MFAASRFARSLSSRAFAGVRTAPLARAFGSTGSSLAPAAFAPEEHRSYGAITAALLAGAAAFTALSDTHCEELTAADKALVANAGKVRPGLPEYSLKTIAEHKTKASGIWVLYKDGVYDITEFVESHPGGSEKIMLAAGGDIEPFWAVYAVHQGNKQAAEFLDGMRIGNLAKADREERARKPAVDADDPFGNEPVRHPALKVNSAKPFNAECPLELITESYITPNALFFVRNHLPVPEVDPKEFRLEVSLHDGKGKTVKFRLEDLKNLPQHTITATMQCAGNRRSEMNEAKPVKGLGWGRAAMSNATWTGVYLRDVLFAAGLPPNGGGDHHVLFEGLDVDHAKKPYGASIPMEKVLNPYGDVLLAFKMNGEDLPRDHGYPVRAVVPGSAGARNVKWVSRVATSKKESESFWQQHDYKALSPAVDWKTAEAATKTAMSIQEMPVQSAITTPRSGAAVSSDLDTVEFKGYAYSGGGREIIRVDVSADGGKTWIPAELTESKQPPFRAWAWKLWEADVPIPVDPATGKKVSDFTVVCKAVDSSCNTQPETFDGIWNLRGLASNAWPRTLVKVVNDEE